MVKSAVSSVFVALWCAAGTQGAPQGAPSNGATLQSLYNAAQQAQKTDNLDEAGRRYRTFLATALGELANSRDQVGDYAKATVLYEEAMALASDPFNEEDRYWRKVVALRLRAGDACVAAAHAAMLHCGARGYLMSHRAQRRLREAYFVAIVTPATKQLRKMLAEM